MGWVQKWQGKNVVIDPNSPSALGVCDESGFDFNHKDLVKQMEWRGDNLVWTGLMVGRVYLDKPQQQNRPPLVKADPRPVKNQRLPSSYKDPDSNKVLPSNLLIAKLQNSHWGS